ILLLGIVDRVDADDMGRLRVIDYKSGSQLIGAGELLEGRRIQLALYALAVEQFLKGRQVVDGFYWHVRAARRSSLALGRFEGGVRGAVDRAVEWALEASARVRAGDFAPRPPKEGCGSYCAGVDVCWQYTRGRRP
ncbi:MAG: PD-(D/E)XK nuclease family protein, partial [Anaerolineae bacterium]|nr:PD-(D/E)XK nuclease family protein [Anaerolineae bacterium]